MLYPELIFKIAPASTVIVPLKYATNGLPGSRAVVVPVFTFNDPLKLDPLLGSINTVPCVWKIPELDTFPPLVQTNVPAFCVKVLVFGLNVPPELIVKTDGVKVTLLDNETFPEALILILVLVNVPVPDNDVAVSKFRFDGFMIPLFVNAEPRIVNVEPFADMVPLFVTVFIALMKYPPGFAASVALASTVIVPLKTAVKGLPGLVAVATPVFTFNAALKFEVF